MDEYTNNLISQGIEDLTGLSKERVFEFLESGRPVIDIFQNNLSLTQDPEVIKNLDLIKELHGKSKIIGEKLFVIDGINAAKNYFSNFYALKNDVERFTVAYLDNMQRIIKTDVMFEGVVNESAVYPRNIIKSAINYEATSVIISHNHPGNSSNPSTADLSVTKKIEKALNSIGIALTDHIIVVNKGATSFAERDLLSGNIINAPFIAANENQGEYRRETTDRFIDLMKDVMNIPKNVTKELLKQGYTPPQILNDPDLVFRATGKKEISDAIEKFATIITLVAAENVDLEAIDSSSKALETVRNYFNENPHVQSVSLSLNSKNTLISIDKVDITSLSIGRDVVSAALNNNAVSIILGVNQSSPMVYNKIYDVVIAANERVKEACESISIRHMDTITTDTSYSQSYAEMDLLDKPKESLFKPVQPWINRETINKVIPIDRNKTILGQRLEVARKQAASIQKDRTQLKSQDKKKTSVKER